MWYWFFGLFFSAMALLGNALIILLIIFKPSLRTSTNCLIVSLAVSDFFAALTYFPVMCISNFFHKIDLSHAGIWYKVCFTFIYCSTTNLCVLAADRYLAVVKPLKYATFTSSKTSRQNILILTGWITPLIFFTLPALFSYQGNDVFTLVFEAKNKQAEYPDSYRLDNAIDLLHIAGFVFLPRQRCFHPCFRGQQNFNVSSLPLHLLSVGHFSPVMYCQGDAAPRDHSYPSTFLQPSHLLTVPHNLLQSTFAPRK